LRIIARKIRGKWQVDVMRANYLDDTIIADSEKIAIAHTLKLMLMYALVLD